jgi:hypothetical protein
MENLLRFSTRTILTGDLYAMARSEENGRTVKQLPFDYNTMERI